MLSFRDNLFGYGLLASVLVAALLIAGCLSPSMDVFGNYHAIACAWFPNAHFNNMGIPCDGRLDLVFPGGFHWPRSYAYVGAADSLYYFPFYLLYPQPISAAIAGLVLLVASFFAAKKFFHCRYEPLLVIVFGNFYVLYQFTYDAGVVGLQILAFFTIPLLVRKALATPGAVAGMCWGIAAGLAAFIAFEAKPIFVYLLPALALVTFAGVEPPLQTLPSLHQAVRRLLPGGMLALILALLLLSASENGYDNSYYDMLSDLSKHYHFLGVKHLERMRFLLATYWGSFNNAAQFSYDFDRNKLSGYLPTAVFWLSCYTTAALYFITDKANESCRRMVRALLLSTLITFVWIASCNVLDNPHHSLPPVVMLCMAVALMVDALWDSHRRIIKALLLLCLASQLCTTIQMALQKPAPKASPDVYKVLHFLQDEEIAKKTLLVGTGWGSQFIYSLYTPREQLFLWGSKLDKKTVERIRQLQQETSRTPIIVDGPLSEINERQVHKYFPDFIVLYPPISQPSDVRLWGAPSQLK